MYSARIMMIVLLIMMIVVAYDPQTRADAGQTWETMRPVVVELMDSTYAAIRNLVAGTGSSDQIQDNAPGVNFDLIITMKQENIL
jgi:hypothetical protein